MKTYTKNQEWIELQDGCATVGITLDAAKEIGEIVYVELPKAGERVQEGQEAVVLESTKAAVDICSPVSGTIIKVNETLRHNIQILNQSPEQDGWLFQVELSTT